MHVDSFEARAREGGGHLDLAVDALLAQDRDARARAGARRTERRRRRRDRRSASTERPGSPASRRAACSSSAEVGSSRSAGWRGSSRTRWHEGRPAIRRRSAARGGATRSAGWCEGRPARGQRAQPVTREHRPHVLDIRGPHRDDRAQLLGEQGRERIGAQLADVDLQARAAGERHLEQRHEQAAVAAVVVGQQASACRQLLDGGEERSQQRRVVEIGRHAADWP